MRREEETKKYLDGKFANDAMAIMAANAVATYFATQGYLTSSYLSKRTRSYKVTIHREVEETIVLPRGYVATKQKDIVNYMEETGSRMATTDFVFEVDE